MENALDWGMDWIIALQAMGSPLLDSFFAAVTFTGEEMFYLLLVPIIFWGIEHRVAARVGFAFLISAYVNPILKDLFPQPRPYQLNPEISQYEVPGSGMPSGHAQSSVFVWGTLAWQIGCGWLWTLAVVWMFLVGFSRVYLGVHFPHQVIAGWIVGAILLLLFILIDPRFEYWMSSLSFGRQLIIAITVPVVMAAAYPHNDIVSSAAVMCGFGSGFVLMRRYCPYSAAGLWWQRTLRSIIGLAGLLALYIGLGLIAPEKETVNEVLYYLSRFLRYGVMGLWISFGAPWFFNLLPPVRQPQPQLEVGIAVD
jgi:membrane-associated phospholipid phosphatase